MGALYSLTEEQILLAERLADSGDPTLAIALLQGMKTNLIITPEQRGRLIIAAAKPNKYLDEGMN